MDGLSTMSDPGAIVTLRYVTTAADQIAKLQRYAGMSSAARWFPTFAYAAIVALSWLSAYLFYVRQGDRNYLYIASGLLALFLTLALPWLYRRYQDNFFGSVLTADNLRGLVGPVELVVSDQSIAEIGIVSTVHAKWCDIVEIDEQAERTFIVVAPLIAIVVPSSAFADAERRREFGALIRARFDASRA